jgi:4-amino-4-deoxy-L-arabinose transferase-like glycosyltransferase
MNPQNLNLPGLARWIDPPYRLLGVIFLFKLAVLFFLLPFVSEAFSTTYSMGFADDYDRLANNIALGNGYRIDPSLTETMLREPGYPLFLAAVFKLGGYSLGAARVSNLLISVGICLMIISLAERSVGDRRAGILAAVIYSVYPGVIVAEARGGVEILFIASVLVFIIAMHDAMTKGEGWRYFLAGILLGVSVLIRSTPMLFPVLLFCYAMFMANSNRERLSLLPRYALLCVGLVLTMSPWIVRNYQLSGTFVPTGTVQGHAAQEGLYTCKRLSATEPFQKLQGESAAERNQAAAQLGVPFRGGYYQFFQDPQSEVTFNRRLLQKVADEYRADPMLLVRCASRNVLNFWFLGKNWSASALNVVVQLPLLVLAVGGALVLHRRGLLRNAGLLIVLSVYVMGIHLPIIAHARHSIPLVPFLAIFAGVVLVELWSRRGGPSPAMRAGGVA